MAAPAKTATGPTQRPNPGLTFKTKIENAKLNGIAPSALLLQLTRGDVSRLKRDPSLATGDISFVDGQMRYLEVKVSEGEVAVSDLVILQP